jgi:hypothetical protein
MYASPSNERCFLLTMRWLVDGGRIAGARRRARPCRRRDQRRGAHIAGWAAGAHATRGFVLVPGPDGSRQGMHCLLRFLLHFSLELVRRNCARRWLDFCSTTSTGHCETLISFIILFDTLTRIIGSISICQK